MRTTIIIILSILLFSSCQRQYTTLIILQDENGVPMDTLYFKGERLTPPTEGTE